MADLRIAAISLGRYLNEAPSGCPICGVICGEHASDMPCAAFDAALEADGEPPPDARTRRLEAVVEAARELMEGRGKWRALADALVALDAAGGEGDKADG